MVLESDVSLQGGLSRVQALALSMGTFVLVVELALGPPLQFFFLFFFPLLDFDHLFKEFEHDFLFFFCFLDVLLYLVVLFGEQDEFLGVVCGRGHEDFAAAVATSEACFGLERQ